MSVAQFRLARPQDCESIRRIYNTEVQAEANTFDLLPRTPGDQRAWLARHQGVYPALVAVINRDGTENAHKTAAKPRPTLDQALAASKFRSDQLEQVIGFGSLSPFRARPAYSTSVEDSVYVDAAHRQAGVGGGILDALINEASSHGFHTVIARIVSHNEASISLHVNHGFRIVGTEVEVGRKHGRWLDVVELQLML